MNICRDEGYGSAHRHRHCTGSMTKMTVTNLGRQMAQVRSHPSTGNIQAVGENLRPSTIYQSATTALRLFASPTPVHTLEYILDE